MSDLQEAERLNLLHVKDVVKRSENPNPLIIILIIVCMILILYCLHTNFIKKSLSGIWYDDNDTTHEIFHNKWRDVITVDKQYQGVVQGYMVVIYFNNDIKSGLWINDTIKWTDGSHWYCSYGL